MNDSETSPNEPDSILDARQAADLLRVHHSTVIAAAQRGQLPHRRVGRLYRFSRAALEAWLRDAPASDPEPREQRKPPAPLPARVETMPFIPRAGSVAERCARRLSREGL